MAAERRTDPQLTAEVTALRQQVATLEAAPAVCRQAQHALQEHEASLRFAISSMDDLVFLLDKQGIFLDQ